MQGVKTLVRLHVCVGSSQPLLLPGGSLVLADKDNIIIVINSSFALTCRSSLAVMHDSMSHDKNRIALNPVYLACLIQKKL